MNYDDEQIVPVSGTPEAPAVSEQTSEPTVTPTPPDTLSLETVERLLSEREAKLRAEFEQQARKNQSKTDKAYADALRKAKVIEESASVLGLDAEQVSAAKAALIDKEFAAAFAEPQRAYDPTGSMTPTNTPQGDFVTESEILSALAAYKLDANAIDLSKYVGKFRGDAELERQFEEEVILARAKKVEARKTQQQQQKQAQAAQQVKQEFGTLAAPAAGAPSAGYDPVKELEKMNAQNPPSDPASRAQWNARYKKLYAEANQKGWS